MAAELAAHRFRDGGRLAPGTAARLAREHPAELLRLALRDADAGRWPAGAFANTLRDPAAVAALSERLADEGRAAASRATARTRRDAQAAHDAALVAWSERRRVWLAERWAALSADDQTAVRAAVVARLSPPARAALGADAPTCKLTAWLLAEVLAERGVAFGEPEPRLELEPAAVPTDAHLADAFHVRDRVARDGHDKSLSCRFPARSGAAEQRPRAAVLGGRRPAG